MTMTWETLAMLYPEFVQWAAQRLGGLPEGEINPEQYETMRIQYIFTEPA